MKPLVVFKIKTFPTFPETFVVTNIIETIRAGYDTVIITDKRNPSELSSQPKQMAEFDLMAKTKIFKEETKKTKRYFEALKLCLNPILFFYFIKYCRLKKKISLSFLFLLHFYLPYRKAKAFHVHFANAVNPLFELKLLGFLNAKIIVTFHGFDAHYLPSGEALENMISNFRSHVFRATVNSFYLKGKLVDKGFDPSKIAIVPIGIDTAFFEREKPIEIPDPQIKLITVGRMVSLKGQEYGLRTVKALIVKGHKVHYTLVGEGENLGKLKALSKALAIEKEVSFLGSRNQQQIKGILEDHHVFLMTSTVDEDGRSEAFGVVSLEAQAMGLPVIGFRSGGFPETVIDGETGFIVPDRDVVAMSRAVERFIQEEILLTEMGVKARRHILQNYPFEKTTKKYLELYD